MTKSEVRSVVRARIEALGPDERSVASREAAKLLTQLPAWRDARSVMLFESMADEIDATPLFTLAWGKHVVVPRWSLRDRVMEAVDVHKRDTTVDPASIDLFVIPGVAFTRAGQRLGRGAGFYDEFLLRARRSEKGGAIFVGYGFACQLVDSMPIEPHDVSMHEVIVA